MEFTADNLEQAVSHFYHRDSALQAQAHQWLTSAQTSPNAWAFVWELLEPNRSCEAQFFAATTLHMKVMKAWFQVPEEEYLTLKRRLLEAINRYATGPKIVLNRLCIALSAYVLQTMPKHWPGAIPELLVIFQPEHLSGSDPDRAAWILLEVLTVIPEEFQSMNLSQSHKTSVRNELENSMAQVILLLESVLTYGRAVSGWELIAQVVRCSSAWFQLGVCLMHCENITALLVDLALSAQVHEIRISSMEAVTSLLTHPDTHKYPAHVKSLLPYVMSLMELTHLEDQELALSAYGVLVGVGECHSQLLLNSLLQTESDRAFSLQLIEAVLSCSGRPGQYPVQESVSQLAFGFWYILQDEMLSRDPPVFTSLAPLIRPIYESLALILLRKSEFPSESIPWSSQDKETFRCYRQDIADTMMYCYAVLRGSLLNMLLARLERTLTVAMADIEQTTDIQCWQPLEAVLHAQLSVAECVTTAEPQITCFFAKLGEIPFCRMDIAITVTALDCIGAYAEWLGPVLGDMVQLLLAGLHRPESAPAATLALKDLTRDSMLTLQPYAQCILEACQNALNSGLKGPECVRLMYTIGRVLSLSPHSYIMQYLDSLLTPYLQQIEQLSISPTSTSAKAVLLVRLKMVSMLCATMDPRLIGGLEQTPAPPSSTPDKHPPVYLVLERVIPVLRAVLNTWCHDPAILQCVCGCLKHSICNLMDACVPLMPAILDLITSSYRIQPHTATLELAKQVVLLFGKTLALSICALLATLIQSTLALQENCSSIQDFTHILETFHQLLALLFKKNAALLLQVPNLDVSALFRFGVLSLGMPEVGTVKASASFLSNLIGLSREQPALLGAVQECGEMLVEKLLLCIGGESPRACLDPLSDIILALNKKHCDNLSRWLQAQLGRDNFPSPRATNDSKQHFAKLVLKERANKRKLQETVREFSLICRGLIGTDYVPGSSNVLSS